MITATEQHIANGGGICGTCAEPATATAENEGYSYCCNDRIEYGAEALETYAQANCSHEVTKIETGRDYVAQGSFANPTFKWITTRQVVCAHCGQYVSEAE